VSPQDRPHRRDQCPTEEEEPEEEADSPAKKSKSLLGTLEDRFVSSTKEKEDEKMEVDADGDVKEKSDT
jgi:hypothetical protein